MRGREQKRRRAFPIVEHPGLGPALIEPSRLYAKRPRVPERCVVCFFSDVIERSRLHGELRRIGELPGEGTPLPVDELRVGDEAVTVVWPGLGAPYAAATLEELIGLGGRAFVCAGGAGVLDGSIPVGRVLIPTAALRDEGTSYHYQRRGRCSRPHPEAVKAIVAACRAAGVSPLRVTTWTTDGVFRETPAAVRARRDEGCLAVEMEAAAFFAVARFRRVVLGQVLYAGDDVSGEVWRHRGWTELGELRERLFRIALDAVCRIDVAPRR